jgi:hypothetical protein
MADTATRIEPRLDAGTPRDEAEPEAWAMVEDANRPEAGRDDGRRLDQISRIEEKTARIEEKYARTEALMMRLDDRVQQSTARSAEAARQADLIAVRDQVAALTRRVRGLPGFGMLFVMMLLTAIVTAALTVAALHYNLAGTLLR